MLFTKKDLFGSLKHTKLPFDNPYWVEIMNELSVSDIVSYKTSLTMNGPIESKEIEITIEDMIDNIECFGINYSGIEQQTYIEFSISPSSEENKIIITFKFEKCKDTQFDEIKIQYDSYIFNKRVIKYQIQRLFKKYKQSKM